MKLPISLLVLAVVGQAAAASETKSTSPTTNKRELHEGNFGQKTQFINRYGASEPSPGIHYAENLQQELQDSSPSYQIFGARISPIPKISDLLSGHGPPFEDALNSHLYSPISVYNTRVAGHAYEIPVTAASKNILSGPKIFKQVKIPSSPKITTGEGNKLLDLTAPHAPLQNTELHSFAQSKFTPSPFQHSTSDLRYEPNHNPGTLPRQNSFPETKTSQLFPVPAEKSYRYPFPNPTQNQAAQSNQVQYVPVGPDFGYKGQEASPEDKENSKDKNIPQAESTRKPEVSEEIPNPNPAYHAHPNGAVSYASVTHNQGSLNQHQFELQYQQLTKIQQEPSVQQSHQQDNIALRFPNEPQQQYIPVPQQQFPEIPRQQQQIVQNKITPIQLLAIPQTQPDNLYLNPIQQNQHQEPQQGQGLQHLEYHQQKPSIQTLPTIGPQISGHPSIHSIFFDQVTPQNIKGPGSIRFRLPDQLSKQSNIKGTNFKLDSIPHYTPVPAFETFSQSTIRLNSPTTVEPPKSQEITDQLVQPTTVQPEISRDEQTEPHTSDQTSDTVTPHQHTVIPLLSSPETLQSLSTFPPTEYSLSSTSQPEKLEQTQSSPTTPYQSVQIQQQELQEIHLNQAPEVRQQQHHAKLKEERQELENRFLQVTPRIYQHLPAPLPAAPSNPTPRIYQHLPTPRPAAPSNPTPRIYQHLPTPLPAAPSNPTPRIYQHLPTPLPAAPSNPTPRIYQHLPTPLPAAQSYPTPRIYQHLPTPLPAAPSHPTPRIYQHLPTPLPAARSNPTPRIYQHLPTPLPAARSNLTPRIYQHLPTPLPAAPSNPDYEIEISPNIDPNQLPKDLRPTTQEENQPQGLQTQLQIGQFSQEFHPNLEQSQQQALNNEQEQNQQQEQNQSPEQTQQVEQTQQKELNLHQEPMQQAELPNLPQADLNPEQPTFQQGNNPAFDSNTQFYINPVQANLHPEFFSNSNEFLVHPDFQQLQVPTFPPVQYFGKYAESIFRGFDR